MTTTVADVVADGVVRAGTEHVLVSRAAAGGACAEALRRRGVAVVEVGGARAACAMAAVTGRLVAVPGVAVTGDDAAGAAAGLAFALAERLPLVAIGSGGGPVAPATVKAGLACGTGSAAHWIAHACRLAATEPWGPVWVEVPVATAEAAAVPVATVSRPDPPPTPDAAALDAAAGLLGAAERPLVVAGALCRSSGDAGWIRAFAEARPAPVLLTRGGRGVLPDPHPLVIGTLDAGDAEREVLAAADLIVAIGVAPGELDLHARLASSVLQLTPAPPADHGAAVVGDLGLILEELAPRLRDARLAEWDVARLHALKQRASAPPTERVALAWFRTVEAARQVTAPGTIAVVDDAVAGAARAFSTVAPGECWVVPGELAPAVAVAARLARGDHRVVCFTSEAALDAAREELAAAVRLGLGVVFVTAAAPPSVPAGVRRLAAASAAVVAPALDAALTAGVPSVVEIGRALGLQKEG